SRIWSRSRAIQTRGGEWQDRVSMMAWYTDETIAMCGGCATGTTPVAATWNQPTLRTGTRRRKLSENDSRPGTAISCMFCARASRYCSTSGRTTSFENYSKPPIRTKATHVANQAALQTLRPAFGALKLAEISPAMVEEHLRKRLGQRRGVHRKEGVFELGI